MIYVIKIKFNSNVDEKTKNRIINEFCQSKIYDMFEIFHYMDYVFSINKNVCDLEAVYQASKFFRKYKECSQINYFLLAENYGSINLCE